MTASRTALIVGAGIGGLAAGVALRNAGWRVQIFERSANPRELGFALGLAANAISALRELGLADVIVANAHAPKVGEMRRADGRLLRRVSFPEVAGNDPTVIALRPVVHGALLNAVGPDALVLASRAVGFETRGGRVTLRLDDGRTATGDVLIGADGVGSVIRTALHPDEPPPRRSGYFALRGVSEDVGNALGDLTGAFYFGDGIEAATMRASQTAVYWYVSLFAERVADGERDPRTVLDRCTSGFDSRFRAITDATRPSDLRLDELFDREPIESWGQGPVTLLGDAAHPMLPHAGQGAAQALVDAVALGLVLGPPGDPAVALRRYERARTRRSARIVKLSRRIARVTTTRNPLIGWLRNTAMRLMPLAALRSSANVGRRDPNLELRAAPVEP